MKHKAGDIVRVRDWDDMKRQYGTDSDGDIPFPDGWVFNSRMKSSCGKDHKISEASDGSYFFEDTGAYSFIDDMLVSAGTGKDKVMKIDLFEIFGVKPDQVFYIKGSFYPNSTKVRVHNNELQREYKGNWMKSAAILNDINHMEIIGYPATEDEKTILRSLDEKYRNWYVARDLCKELYIYEKLPKKREEYYASNAGLATRLPYSDLFQFIQFETGAVQINDIIGE